jgi:prepilin-type processing-associated H-X9-DG protein
MSHAFGQGEWLDKNYNTSQSVWRTYSRASDIMRPAQTFLFVDVHPDSINDSSFKNACTGAQPADPPTAAQLIDYPSPLHNGAGNLSFADGRVETHRWQGSKIRNCLVRYDFMSLNGPAETSWMDVRWIAERTTARR